jgi:hypothetical protein
MVLSFELQRFLKPGNGLAGTDVVIGDPENHPTGKSGQIVFFAILLHSHPSVVPALDKAPTLNFEEELLSRPGKIGTKISAGVEFKLPYRHRETNGSDMKFHGGFKFAVRH